MKITWWPVSEITAEERSEWGGDTQYWVTVPMFVHGKYCHSCVELAYYDELEDNFSCDGFANPLDWGDIDAIALAEIPKPYIAPKWEEEK